MCFIFWVLLGLPFNPFQWHLCGERSLCHWETWGLLKLALCGDLATDGLVVNWRLGLLEASLLSLLLMDKAAAGTCVLKQGLGLPQGLCWDPICWFFDQRKQTSLGDVCGSMCVYVCICMDIPVLCLSGTFSNCVRLIKRKPRISHIVNPQVLRFRASFFFFSVQLSQSSDHCLMDNFQGIWLYLEGRSKEKCTRAISFQNQNYLFHFDYKCMYESGVWQESLRKYEVITHRLEALIQLFCMIFNFM